MIPDATTRAAALEIMAKGRATIAEVAGLVGISRQAARMWAQRAAIDPVANRERYLSDLWARALGQSAGARSKRRQRQPPRP